MKKTIVLITKSLCYHQVYLADELYKIYGDDFTFIQMREPLDFRVAAHQEGFERSYLKGWARSEEERKIWEREHIKFCNKKRLKQYKVLKEKEGGQDVL